MCTNRSMDNAMNFHTDRTLSYIEATSSWPCIQGNTQHKLYGSGRFLRIAFIDIRSYLMKNKLTYTYLACMLHSMFYNDAGSK